MHPNNLKTAVLNFLERWWTTLNSLACCSDLTQGSVAGSPRVAPLLHRSTEPYKKAFILRISTIHYRDFPARAQYKRFFSYV